MSNTPADPIATGIGHSALPPPKLVPLEAPWRWLAEGWRDMWRIPGTSLAYGAAFVSIAAGLLWGLTMIGAQSMFLALAGGFLLIGPLLATGLYEASRRLQQNQAASLGNVVWAWGTAKGQLGFFGAGLLFLFLVWLETAFLLFMLFMGGRGLPPPAAFMQTLLYTGSGLGLLTVGTAVGACFAAVVFSVSATAVPLLLRHEIDAVTAARASLAAVRLNVWPMALWAGLIAMIMAAGFGCLLAGLIIAFPWIGHATWHAYAEIYGDTGRS